MGRFVASISSFSTPCEAEFEEHLPQFRERAELGSAFQILSRVPFVDSEAHPSHASRHDAGCASYTWWSCVARMRQHRLFNDVLVCHHVCPAFVICR